jgi:hypothetical protein
MTYYNILRLATMEHMPTLESQNKVCKNGTEWVAQEVQLELEINYALTPLTTPLL